MFPTTLAAMGCTIEGDRLGIGTNLFSGKPTLTEKYGYDKLNLEISKRSDFYNTQFDEKDKM
jgi:phosphoglycerol transferase